MGAVRDQGDGTAEHAIDDLGHDEADIEDDANEEGAAEIRRGMDVARMGMPSMGMPAMVVAAMVVAGVVVVVVAMIMIMVMVMVGMGMG
jgi:hypothetical protein